MNEIEIKSMKANGNQQIRKQTVKLMNEWRMNSVIEAARSD